MAKRPTPAPADGFASWSTQLRKGIIELMILSLVDQEQLYGYAIVRELKERGGLIAGEGTVYPVLRRLEADGLVSAAWSDEGPAGPRKYYRITQAGRTFRDRAWTEWETVAAALNDLGGKDRR
ncbi:MAG: PadR family transcriptional regulator [Coriobacteriia bacterium]|nr:PadR family transcriptional regulator [Coriobacteriia bacterium]